MFKQESLPVGGLPTKMPIPVAPARMLGVVGQGLLPVWSFLIGPSRKEDPYPSASWDVFLVHRGIGPLSEQIEKQD